MVWYFLVTLQQGSRVCKCCDVALGMHWTLWLRNYARDTIVIGFWCALCVDKMQPRHDF